MTNLNSCCQNYNGRTPCLCINEGKPSLPSSPKKLSCSILIAYLLSNQRNAVSMRSRLVMLLVFLCLVQPLPAQFSFVDNYFERSEAAATTPEALEKMDIELKQVESIKSRYPDSALRLCRKIYEDSRRMQFHDGMASSLLWMGSVYLSDKGQPIEALGYFRMAEQHCRRAVNVKDLLLLLWHNDMASAFSVQGQYDSALVYYYRNLNMALQQDWKNSKDLVMMYNNIASVYYVLEQYDEARSYLRKSVRISDSAGFTAELFNAYNTYASLFAVQKKLDSAELYINKMEMLKASGLPVTDGSMAYLKGILALYRKDYQAAIPSFEAALKSSNGNAREEVNNLAGLGVAYLFGNRYGLAAQYLEHAISLSLKSGISGRGLVDNYGNLAEVYDSSGDYKRAYHYRSLASDLKDSLNRMENAKRLHTFETRYQAAEKNKELAENQLQLARAETTLRKKNMWIAFIISGMLVLVIVATWLSQKQRLQLQKEKTARKQQQVKQLKAVLEGEEKERSRIGRQLHDDIMVQLSVVKMGLEALPMGYPDIKKADTYNNVLQQLTMTSQQLRQTAHNLMPDALLEEGLVSAVLYFCRSVEKLSGIRFQFQHYGEIPVLSSDVEVNIYRIIQELVQNIIKHAKAANALVQLHYRKGILSITVEDDGTGMQSTDVEESKMGLKSIRTRLKTLDGSMEIHPCTPHGTSVNIELGI